MDDAKPLRSGRRKRIACVCALAVCAATLAACGGSQHKPDALPAPVWKSQLDHVPDDARFVLTVNRLDQVSRSLRATQAWEELFKFVGDRAPHLQGLRPLIEELADILERDLSGRITVAIWEPTPDHTQRRWLVLSEGKIQAVVRAGERVVRQPAGQLVHVGDDVFQYTGGSAQTSEAYLLQTPSMGLLASDRDTLAAAVEPSATALSADRTFATLVADVDGDGEVLFWMRDWTDGDDNWSDMANLATSEPAPRAALLSLRADAGVRGNFAIEFDAERNAAFGLPQLEAAKAPLRSPRLLPATTVAFAGLQTRGPSFGELLGPMLEDASPDAAVFAELLGGLQGEIAWAVTEAGEDAPTSGLGFPVPEVAVLARLREGVDPAQLEPLVASLFRILHLEVTGTADMGPPATRQVGASTVTSFSTADPAIQVAYGTVDGFLVVGTLGAVESIARTAAGEESQSLAGGANPRAMAALARPWNYVAVVDFGQAYRFIKKNWGGMIGIMSDGVVGGRDDALEFLFSVVPSAGATVGFGESTMVGEFWLSAQDVR